jgi:hypothetical protein
MKIKLAFRCKLISHYGLKKWGEKSKPSKRLTKSTKVFTWTNLSSREIQLISKMVKVALEE